MNVLKSSLTLTGSLTAAIVASACCIGPLVFALLGIGGVSFALALEPYRPYFLGATFLLLGGAFYYVYRRPKTGCGPGESCELPKTQRVGRILLWIVTVLVILASTFPYYSVYLF